jgi:hypothetical protein
MCHQRRRTRTPSTRARRSPTTITSRAQHTDTKKRVDSHTDLQREIMETTPTPENK